MVKLPLFPMVNHIPTALEVLRVSLSQCALVVKGGSLARRLAVHQAVWATGRPKPVTAAGTACATKAQSTGVSKHNF